MSIAGIAAFAYKIYDIQYNMNEWNCSCKRRTKMAWELDTHTRVVYFFICYFTLEFKQNCAMNEVL